VAQITQRVAAALGLGVNLFQRRDQGVVLIDFTQAHQAPL